MPPTTRGIRAVRGTQKIGEKLAQAMQKVGNEGVITVEEAKSLTTELEVVEGQCSSTAATSRPLCHQCREMIAELENPYILLHEKKLSGLQAMLPLLETVVQSGRLLLIVAEDVEGEALATLLVNKLRGGLRLKRGAGCTHPRVRSGRFIMPRRRAEARTLAVGNVLVPRDSEKQNGGVGLGKVCHVQSKVLHTAGSCSADGVAAAKAALPPNWTN